MDDWTVLVCSPCWHELVIASHGMLNKKIWERTRSDIMIEIHLPNIEKGSIGLGRQDLSDYHSQSRIRRHKLYKMAKDSNVNDVIPNFFVVIDGLLKRTLDPMLQRVRGRHLEVSLEVWAATESCLWMKIGGRENSYNRCAASC